MKIPSRLFESLFGVADAEDRDACVKESTAVFHHLGNVITREHSPQGRPLSAWEVWTRLPTALLNSLASEGEVRLPFGLLDVAEDLARQRNALGLTVREVARQAKLNVKIAQKIEKGRYPDILSVERYASALGLDESRIGVSRLDHGGGLAVRLRDLSQQGARSRKGLSPAAVATLSNASWISATQVRLNGWQRLRGKDWRREFEPDYDYGGIGHEPWEAGFRLARRTREVLGVGADAPIESMRRLVEERLKIPLIQAELPPHIAGATLSHGKGRAIVVNTVGDNENEWVRRATIAHELGHLLWDPDERLRHLIVDSYKLLSSVERHYDPIEARANAFAIEFLCPKTAVMEELKNSHPSEALRNLMVRYGVSMTATRQHMWNAQKHLFELKSIRASAAPTDEWKARESFTVDWFPVASTSTARRGAFAGLTAQAALSGQISEGTAANYLEAEQPLSHEQLGMVRDLFEDILLPASPLDRSLEKVREHRVVEDGDLHPLVANQRWLVAHAREFASRWIALKGGDLVADAETLVRLESSLGNRGLRLEDVHFLRIGADFA